MLYSILSALLVFINEIRVSRYPRSVEKVDNSLDYLEERKMTLCCDELQESLRCEDIMLVIKHNELRLPANLKSPNRPVRFCPHCGKLIKFAKPEIGKRREK